MLDDGRLRSNDNAEEKTAERFVMQSRVDPAIGGRTPHNPLMTEDFSLGRQISGSQR
jgi:hypothetical protein